jgi:Leucine-rich repeat (LRR) protein
LYDLFFGLSSLEILDLSNNLIECVENKRIVYSLDNKIKSINLENNKILFLAEKIFYSLDYLEHVKMSGNKLKLFPNFVTDSSNKKFNFKQIFANNNKITMIKQFSYPLLSEIQFIDFDSNQISTIETEAFLNCRSLEYLSLFNNSLTKIGKIDFYYLFSLKFLNLSTNQIDSIESDSFQSLNKLIKLDLNMNRLLSIDPNMFNGLFRLKDLFLLNRFDLKLNNQSFNHLTSLANIYLNESIIVKNVCLFIQIFERNVQRNISNKLIYYKSLNLILNKSDLLLSSSSSWCGITFHLLQFKIHLNLKTDYENELFYDKCKHYIIHPNNRYRFNYEKCFIQKNQFNFDTI